MPDNTDLQKTFIRSSLHEVRNTVYLLCELSSRNSENMDVLNKVFDKSEEILLFLRSDIDSEKKAHLYLSKFISEVSEIDLLCRQLTNHFRQKDFVDAAGTLKELTIELQSLIEEGRT